MAALTQEAVRALAGRRSANGPVVSLYLDVDGRRLVRPRDYEQQLEAMVRKALDDHGAPVEADLRRIEAHVKAGLDRSRMRGIAVFSCLGDGIWEVVELPVPVRNQVVVNAHPHIRPLEQVLDENERFAVLLADKQRVRMFLFELGAVRDRSELFDQLPRHEDDKGDWDKDHVRDHSAEHVHHHLKRAADAAFAMFQTHGFDHLIIGAPEEIANEVERCLHSYLKERVAARVNVPVSATEAAVREAALAVEADVERAKEAKLVERLRDAVGAGNGGVAGLEPVLGALMERRVERLLVSDGYEAPGWRCTSCRAVARIGPTCPICSTAMDKVDDVVEEAVDEALHQSCRVEVVVGNADLDVLGRIGALLRY